MVENLKPNDGLIQYDNEEGTYEVEKAPNEYLSAEYQVDPETGMPLGQEPVEDNTEKDDQLAELSKKLGVDPDEIGREEESKEDGGKEKSDEESDDSDKESEEAIKKRIQNVDKELKQLLGTGLTEVYGLIQELSEFRNQYYIQQQQAALQSEWGESFDDNFKQVQEKWNTLPEKQKAALNNVDGAKMLLALIEREQKGNTVQSNQTSTYVRSNKTGSSGEGKRLRMSEIIKLPQAEYVKRQREIELAFKEGRVIKDY